MTLPSFTRIFLYDVFYSKRLHTFICAPHLSDHTEEAVIKMSLVADDVLAVLEGCESK